MKTCPYLKKKNSQEKRFIYIIKPYITITPDG